MLFKKITTKLFYELNKALSKKFENILHFEKDDFKLDNIIEEKPYSFAKKNFNYSGRRPYWFDFNEIKHRSVGLRKVDNVKIISGGIILNENGEIILESAIFQKEYLFKLNKNHYVFFRNFLPVVKYEKVIVLANYLGKQYYHWNMESLSRLLLIKREELREFKILINSNAPKFVSESLSFLFDIEEKNIISEELKMIKCKQTIIPSFPFTRNESTKMTFLYSPFIIKALNNLSKLKTEIQVDGYRNIIISRINASQRKIINIDKILKRFSNLNFEVVCLEDLSFQDQIQLFRSSKVIIATHGAGLVNLLYSENPIVIEFFPSNRTTRDSFYFFQISSALNYHHLIIDYEAKDDKQDLIVKDSHLNQIDFYLSNLTQCNSSL